MSDVNRYKDGDLVTIDYSRFRDYMLPIISDSQRWKYIRALPCDVVATLFYENSPEDLDKAVDALIIEACDEGGAEWAE